MDLKKIQELVKLINKSNIGELSIEEKDFKITIKQKEDSGQQFLSPAQSLTQPPSSQLQQGGNVTPQISLKSEEDSKADNYVTIKSPMIGTFYRQAGPGKPIFINVGDEVETGTVVCIIEAMKLFNEIESEVSGKIIKVLVEDASPVEYDQPLFMVDPS